MSLLKNSSNISHYIRIPLLLGVGLVISTNNDRVAKEIDKFSGVGNINTEGDTCS